MEKKFGKLYSQLFIVADKKVTMISFDFQRSITINGELPIVEVIG